MTVSIEMTTELYELIRKLAINEKMDDSTIAQYLEIQYPGITLMELVAVIRQAVEINAYGY